MSTNKTYQKWYNLVLDKANGQPWTEKEIIYFRKAINQSGLKDQILREQLLDHFQDSMPIGGYNITLEQQDKGINYLKSNSYKKNGSLRKNNIFNTNQLSIIKNYSHFKLVDIVNASENSYQYYLPVYRCIDTFNNYFDYLGTVYPSIKVLNTRSVVKLVLVS